MFSFPAGPVIGVAQRMLAPPGGAVTSSAMTLAPHPRPPHVRTIFGIFDFLSKPPPRHEFFADLDGPGRCGTFVPALPIEKMRVSCGVFFGKCGFGYQTYHRCCVTARAAWAVLVRIIAAFTNGKAVLATPVIEPVPKIRVALDIERIAVIRPAIDNKRGAAPEYFFAAFRGKC